MVCPGNPPASLGNGGEVVKCSSMPGRNDRVVLAMHHQQGAGDLANAPVVPELVDWHNGNDGSDPEGGHKRALQDQPGDLVPGGEMKGDPRASSDSSCAVHCHGAIFRNSTLPDHYRIPCSNRRLAGTAG